MRQSATTVFLSVLLVGWLTALTIDLNISPSVSASSPGQQLIYNNIDRSWEPVLTAGDSARLVTLDQTQFFQDEQQERLEQERIEQEEREEREKREAAAMVARAERVAPPPPSQSEGRKGADTPPPPPPPSPPPPVVTEPEDDPEPPENGEPDNDKDNGKDEPPPQPPQPPPPDGIMLGWHFVAMNSTAYVQYPSSQTGYNVYAPVVYFVTGSGSDIRIARHNQFSRGVLTMARDNGYQVWITVQQFGAERARQLFGNPGLQTAVIGDLVQKALSDGAHGINIDFENMGLANRDGFTAFMQELHRETKKHGLILSVDVTRPGTSSWSACYDHGALAGACDYMVLMAYDQYYAGSPVAGPVASLSWTESAITAVLGRGVPPEKLVLGVPFYSRNWVLNESSTTVTEDSIIITGDVVNLRPEPSTDNTPVAQVTRNTILPYRDTVTGESINGNTDWYEVAYNEKTVYVSATLGRFVAAGETIGGESGGVSRSFALGLQHTLAMQANYNPETRTSHYTISSGRVNMYDVTIQDDRGLTLISYRNAAGEFNQIWAEDYASLQRRYKLVGKYNLAGAAAWSLEWQSNVASPWLEMIR